MSPPARVSRKSLMGCGPLDILDLRYTPNCQMDDTAEVPATPGSNKKARKILKISFWCHLAWLLQFSLPADYA